MNATILSPAAATSSLKGSQVVLACLPNYFMANFKATGPVFWKPESAVYLIRRHHHYICAPDDPLTSDLGQSDFQVNSTTWIFGFSEVKIINRLKFTYSIAEGLQN